MSPVRRGSRIRSTTSAADSSRWGEERRTTRSTRRTTTSLFRGARSAPTFPSRRRGAPSFKRVRKTRTRTRYVCSISTGRTPSTIASRTIRFTRCASPPPRTRTRALPRRALPLPRRNRSQSSPGFAGRTSRGDCRAIGGTASRTSRYRLRRIAACTLTRRRSRSHAVTAATGSSGIPTPLTRARDRGARTCGIRRTAERSRCRTPTLRRYGAGTSN
jgi:hypothetical protein